MFNSVCFVELIVVKFGNEMKNFEIGLFGKFFIVEVVIVFFKLIEYIRIFVLCNLLVGFEILLLDFFVKKIIKN